MPPATCAATRRFTLPLGRAPPDEAQALATQRMSQNGRLRNVRTAGHCHETSGLEGLQAHGQLFQHYHAQLFA
jgi:predicted alpha/beta hydrolase family esterase